MESRAVGVISSLLRELRLPSPVLSPLLSHAEAVRADADRLGLLSHADHAAVVERHTADSLLFALARAPREAERWVDVGSGAGFPGLVLAICYPDTAFTLVEPQRRRAAFLEMQVARLGLENVEVIVARAEALEARFDVAVARALADPARAFELLARLASGGEVVLAVGDLARAPAGATVIDVSRPRVDSPGRFLMMARDSEGAG